MKESGSSSAVFWAAAILAGLAWTGARADIEDEKGAKEALKAVRTSPKSEPITVAPVPVQAPGELSAGGDAKSSPFAELTAANYESVATKDAPVFLVLYTNNLAAGLANTEKALAPVATKHSAKLAFARLELKEYRKCEAAKKLKLPETPPTPLFILIRGQEPKHRYDNYDPKDYPKDPTDPKSGKMTLETYTEAMIHNCLVKLDLKPEPPVMTCYPDGIPMGLKAR